MSKAWTRYVPLTCLVTALCLFTACAGENTNTTRMPEARTVAPSTVTLDTTNQATALRAQHPSEELFTNDNWRTLGSDLHEGAPIDVVAQISGGPDVTTGHWIKWEMFVPCSKDWPSIGEWVMCVSNVLADTALIQQKAWVHVQGVVLRSATPQEMDWRRALNYRIIYVETLVSSAEPTTTTIRPVATTYVGGDPYRCLDCGYEWDETYEGASEDFYDAYGSECPSCGGELDDDGYCSECGFSVEDWSADWAPYCPECGSENVEILD